MAFDPLTAQRVRAVLSVHPDLEEKKLMGGLSFMVNGAMCCSVSGKGGLLIRVKPDVQERLLADSHVAPMKMGERTVRNFLRVDAEGFRTDKALRMWLQHGLDAVQALPAEKKSRSKAKASAEPLALYEKLVATNPAVERKGATMPYTSVNGHMFSYLGKDGVVALRLPPGEREAFLKKYKTKLREAYGTVQTEYVEVPAELLASTKELKRFFDLSYAHVSSLKPKATTRKKKA